MEAKTTEKTNEDLLTATEAAALAGISVSTLYQRIQNSEVTAVILWGRTLFRRKDIEALEPPSKGRPRKATK